MLLHLESGEYYELQGAGPYVWSLLDGEASLDEIGSRIVDGYGVAADLAAGDLRRFVDALAERGLLARSAGGTGTGGDLAVEVPTLDYAAPRIESRGNLKYLGQLD